MPRKNKTFTFHDSINESVEWYTPPNIFESIGVEFDLDPCSSEKANTIVQAKDFYTIDDNGLEQDWYGKVWLNPPYGNQKGNQTGVWLQKALDETVDENIQVCALVFARTDVKWFHEQAVLFEQICFMKGRLSFINGNTMQQGATSGAGSMLITIGDELNNAVANSDLGWVVNTAVNDWVIN
jgi:phage N-6-adenine-methyltransferase